MKMPIIARRRSKTAAVAYTRWQERGAGTAFEQRSAFRCAPPISRLQSAPGRPVPLALQLVRFWFSTCRAAFLAPTVQLARLENSSPRTSTQLVAIDEHMRCLSKVSVVIGRSRLARRREAKDISKQFRRSTIPRARFEWCDPTLERSRDLCSGTRKRHLPRTMPLRGGGFDLSS